MRIFVACTHYSKKERREKRRCRRKKMRPMITRRDGRKNSAREKIKDDACNGRPACLLCQRDRYDVSSSSSP